MAWIHNVSLSRVINGDHFNPGKSSMLISIVDPDMDFPVPKYKFKEIHGFKFLDLERDDDFDHDKKITDNQAQELINVLKRAIKEDMNVVVHCNMGHCRSGAVAEVGEIMGMKIKPSHRSPNLLVKHKLLKLLGFTYDKEEI